MPAAADLHVLIVDDQKSIRALVRGALQQLGCRQIAESGDGLEALDVLRTNPVHLIISDLNMPNLDGLGLLEAVRGKPEFKKIAFIMLTNRGDVELVRKAIALGVNNYLIKPFALGALKAKIEAVFGPLT
ncbi:MAG TPA: response regulator [Caulobacterales bacterium]|jgi:two-component system chemotaxis response regulator CheY|nr:response regulator [Caulobacterales bacterium]